MKTKKISLRDARIGMVLSNSEPNTSNRKYIVVEIGRTWFNKRKYILLVGNICASGYTRKIYENDFNKLGNWYLLME